MIFFVYGYWETGYENPFYIGKGHGNRDREHLKSSLLYKKNTLLYQRLRRLDGDPIIKRIQDNMTEQEAFDLEIKLIEQYGRLDMGTGCLTNMTDGGQGSSGILMSDEQRALISQAQTGRKWTEDMKIDASSSRSGLKKPHSFSLWRSQKNIQLWNDPEYRAKRQKPVSSFCPLTNILVKTYPSAKAAQEEDGYCRSGITACCKGKIKEHSNLVWRYA